MIAPKRLVQRPKALDPLLACAAAGAGSEGFQPAARIEAAVSRRILDPHYDFGGAPSISPTAKVQPISDAGLPVQSSERSGWRGALTLRYELRGAATVLAARRHTGPVLVQKPLYPEGEGVCHSIVLHPPGGIVGGDRIELAASLAPKARALLTTPGAAKWYRSAGASAEQQLSFEVGAGASLEWLPQPTIVFDGARGEMRADVEVHQESTYIGWEVTCLGRTAAGERLGEGEMLSCTRVTRGGRPVWLERGRIVGGSPLLVSPIGFAGEPVHATLVAVSAAVDAALLGACRQVEAQSGRYGVTRLPGLLLARYLGPRSDHAHDYFVRLWQLLRPALIGRVASALRIWRT